MTLSTEEGKADLMEEESWSTDRLFQSGAACKEHTCWLHTAARLTQEGSSAADEAEKAAFRGESSAFTAKSREERGVSADLHPWWHHRNWDVCVPVCVSWGQRATKDPAHARKTPSSVIHRQRRTSPQTTPHLCFNLWQLRCSFLNMNSYGFVALATVSPVSTGANGPNLIQHTKVKEGNCTASSIYQQTITGHTHTIHLHRGTLESLALTCMLVGGNQRSRKPKQNV